MSQNLSPFHAELLAFIQRDAEHRIALEGFDPASDIELGKFQNLLKRALALDSAEASLSLGDIIDNYHYLFQARGPIHLEKKLLDAFSSREAGEHGLRIYRGLPRLYRANLPVDSHVKKNFTHLPTLKRLASEKAVFQIYESQALPESSRLSLLTWVINDGWGDYIAAFETIEILKKRFPALEMSWVVFVPSRLGLSKIPQGCKTHLISYEKEMPFSQIEREALEILRTSDLVLQIPTFYPAFAELKAAVESIPFSHPPPIWSSMGEYGFLESSWYHPRTGNRSMGLHFLEKGVLIRGRHLEEPTFEALENEQLLDWLFATSTPAVSLIERYKEEHHFYLSYLTSAIGGAVYLHALFKAHEKDQKGIDLCVPDLGWLIRFIDLQTRGGRPILETDGIALEIYFQGKFVTLSGGQKKVRIFCPSPITAADFRRLLHLSGEFVGVRGDQSFTEAVSENRGFFYDSREHGCYFIKDLLALAENRIGMHRSTLKIFRGMGRTFLHNLPAQVGEWVDETYFQEKQPWTQIAANMGLALQDPDAVAGFKKLNRIIAEEHAFNAFVCRLVQRELCHRAHPEQALIEEASVSLFAEGRCSLQQLIEDLKGKLYGR